MSNNLFWYSYRDKKNGQEMKEKEKEKEKEEKEEKEKEEKKEKGKKFLQAQTEGQAGGPIKCSMRGPRGPKNNLQLFS